MAFAQDAAFQELWSIPSTVIDLDVSKDGSLVAMINRTGVYVFDTEASDLVWSDEVPPLDIAPLQVAISADGNGVVVVYQVFIEPSNVTLAYYDSNGNFRWLFRELGTFGPLPNTGGRTSKLVDISDDGEHVALALNLQDTSTLFYWNESTTDTATFREPK